MGFSWILHEVGTPKVGSKKNRGLSKGNDFPLGLQVVFKNRCWLVPLMKEMVQINVLLCARKTVLLHL